MQLLIGSHVREQGHPVGRLAGFELEPETLRITRIIFSGDGDLGPHAHTRALAAVERVSDGGDIALAAIQGAPLPAVQEVVLLSRATRVYRWDRDASRLAGVDVNLTDCMVAAALGRAHWWSRRFSLPANTIDWSTPGEIRQRSDHRAA
jgi:hypothetical protein